MSDLIDREQAKDAIDKYLVGRNLVTDGTMMARLINGSVIDRLPSAKPEIIYCKDCKHYEYGICKKAGLCVNKSPNGFCDWGERREEGET